MKKKSFASNETREGGEGVRAKKSLGQNFLMHQQTAERIADAAHLTKKDTVLEIGPGTGMLTRALLTRAGKVIAIEADSSLIPRLAETFTNEIKKGKLQLISGDIRTFDTSLLPKSFKLVANIPYYITGELLRTFLSGKTQPSSITFLVQKEVAERIARNKKESLLSLSVKAYGTPHYEFTVPRGAFVPAPNVDSAVLTISDISRKNFRSRAEEEHFFKLIHAGFAHKRKMLGKNLETAGLKVGATHEKARAEDLGLQNWIEFSRKTAT